ncbi:LysR substrate binding domain protein [compost metagenome]
MSGQATFNGTYQMLNAALSGCGLAFVPQDLVQPHLEAGRLQAVLQDWAPVFPGLHAYYPIRRQKTRTLGLLIEALRTTPAARMEG